LPQAATVAPCDAVSVQRRAFSALRIASSANIQGTATLYCRQHHFGRDLPLWPFVFHSRQCLDVIARITQGAEHTGSGIGTWKARDQDISDSL